jgi:hypothetical protein
VFAFVLLLASPADLRISSQEPFVFDVPGVEASDEAVRHQAETMCGQTNECIDRQMRARDRLVRLYGDMPSQRKKIARSLLKETQNGLTNWEWAEKAVRFRPYEPGYSVSVSCRSVATRHYANTTCTAY